MSEVMNLQCGICPVGPKSICQCPKPTRHALTREQVESICRFLVEEHLSTEAATMLAHDAAQRQALAQQAQRITEWEDQWRKTNAQYEASAKAVTRQAQELAQRTTERDDAERREQQWEQDYATDLRACQRERQQADTALADTTRRLAESEQAAYDTMGTIGVLTQRVAGLTAELEAYRSLAEAWRSRTGRE